LERTAQRERGAEEMRAEEIEGVVQVRV